MANLSNINGKFVVEQTTGYVGVGTTDPNYPIEVLNASAEIALNASGASIYRLRSDSTDSFRINKNGVGDRLVIDGSGNVGIGTDSPDAKLEVYAGASTTQDDILWGGIIRNSANSAVNTGYGAGLKLKVSSDTTGEINKWAGIAGIAGSTFSNVTDLAFYANPTASNVPIELMRLTGEGKLGIGTDSPDAKLHVYNGDSGATTVGGASDELILENDTDCGLTIRSGTSSDGVISFADSGDHNIGQVYYSHGSNSMTFRTNDNNAVTINSSQNVGIGTTLPQNDKLHVETDTSTVYDGNSNQTGGLFVNNIYHEALNTFSQIRLGVSGASGASSVRLVGIEPSQAASDFAIVLRNGSVWGEKLRIKGATGNVGIGVTGPVTTLQVSGSNLTNNVAAYIGGGFVGNDLYHREGGLLVISGTNATQTSAGIAFQTRNTGNTNYWKSSILMNRGGELEFYTGGAGTAQGSKRMHIYWTGVVEVAGDLNVGGTNKARFKSDGTNTYVDAIPANSEIRFRVAGAVEKFRIAASGATTQTMDSTTSLSHLWSQGVPLQNVWYTVYTYSQYDSVCFFAMVSFENDAGDGANQSAMFATSAGAAYGAAFGVQQISGGTGIEARRSSTSFQVRQTIGAYTSSTRLNVRFVSIN